MARYTYPLSPENVSEDIIKPSPQFTREVRKVVITLIFFGLLYFLVLAGSVGITLLFGFIGFGLVMGLGNLWGIIIGLGIAGIGAMVLFFVIKFLFAKKVDNNTNRREITEAEYPDLFAFIRRISEETNTDFPKHIYLSPEVNAAVFYDSGFWSMLLPVRKNLVIGLGLINMTNLSEFKSVIAHEFGHFSQKSMRAGSYVYHANKVLYNMLYENTGYIAVLQRWANIHTIFAICANITIKIVQAIQWILRQAYQVVNKQYMSLSRQMEFHADAMSAKVAGGNNAIHALRRIEFADVCYHTVIDRYNKWLPENLKGKNLFTQQRIAASFIAGDYNLQLVGGLPLLHDADKHYKNFSRIQVGEQWASHPPRSQREAALNALNVTGTIVDEPVWTLFPDAQELQETFTEQLYIDVPFKAAVVTLEDTLFADRHATERNQYSYPLLYNGYYNGRDITLFEVETSGHISRTITDLKAFFEQEGDSPAIIEATRNDLQLLDQISDRKSGIRTFDFDGDRYKREDALTIKKTLEAELALKEKTLQENDERVYHTCLYQAGLQSTAMATTLTDAYRYYFQFRKLVADNIDYCNRMRDQIQPIYTTQSLETAKAINQELLEAVISFKAKLNSIAAELVLIPGFETELLPDELTGLQSKHLYFIDATNHLNTAHLEELWSYVQQFGNWTFEILFKAQKTLVTLQASLIKDATTGN